MRHKVSACRLASLSSSRSLCATERRLVNCHSALKLHNCPTPRGSVRARHKRNLRRQCPFACLAWRRARLGRCAADAHARAQGDTHCARRSVERQAVCIVKLVRHLDARAAITAVAIHVNNRRRIRRCEVVQRLVPSSHRRARPNRRGVGARPKGNGAGGAPAARTRIRRCVGDQARSALSHVDGDGRRRGRRNRGPAVGARVQRCRAERLSPIVAVKVRVAAKASEKYCWRAISVLQHLRALNVSARERAAVGETNDRPKRDALVTPCKAVARPRVSTTRHARATTCVVLQGGRGRDWVVSRVGLFRSITGKRPLDPEPPC